MNRQSNRSTRPSATAPRLRCLAWLVPAAAALGLVGCGGGSSTTSTGGTAATVQVKGVAATGAAIAGATVNVVNANGVTATGTTGSDGSFSVSISDGAPFALSVKDAAGKEWYSFAPDAATTANVTPLTTLALLDANAQKSLAEMWTNWANSTQRLSADAVLASAKKVNATLRNQITAAGLDASALNVFSHSFTPNHSGLDAVLDAMRLSYNCSASTCSQTITDASGNTLATWNASISTTGIALSWTAGAGGAGGSGTVNVSLGACSATPVAGTYSMVVQYTATGLPAPIPDICVDGLPEKPASQAEFCGGDYSSQMPDMPGISITGCSYADPVGTITAKITSPLTIDYAIKMTFVKR